MIKFDRINLRNGLTIVSHHRERATQAIVCVTYRAGSVDDYEGRGGLANLVRWALHSSSINIIDHVPYNEAAGVSVDSDTTYDVSQFSTTLPQENLETAFWMQSDRMLGAKINKEDIPRLKKWLQGKIKYEGENEHNYIQNVVLTESYDEHPYRSGVLGSENSVKNIDLSDVQSFHKYFYTPSNACLMVSSGLPADRVFELAEKWFGGIPPSPVGKAVRPVEAVRTRPKSVELDQRGPDKHVYRAFPVQGFNTDEHFYAGCLAEMQRNRLLSPLRDVAGDKKIFSNINAWLVKTFESDQLIFAAAVRKTEYMDAAIYELDEALSKLTKYSPEDWEVEGLMNRRRYYFGAESRYAGDKFVRLASVHEMAGGAERYNDSLERVLSLDIKKMSRAWKQILNPQRMVTVISGNNKK